MGFADWEDETPWDRKKLFFPHDVYEQWFKVLRLSDKYRETCDKKGKGELAPLYADFGDIYSVDFSEWFYSDAQARKLSPRAVYLFAEPTSLRPRQLRAGEVVAEGDIVVAFPRDVLLRFAVSGVRTILEKELGKRKVGGELPTRARYRVSIRNPEVDAIKRAVRAFELKKKGDKKLHEIADDKDVAATGDGKAEKAQKVSKLVKRCEGYIEAAEKGQFPTTQ
ncbi:MAG: hypothetical protein H9535_19275 [Ignavibacteria bacterium]|nr:hypothetical protein [Ignavibacteria bacterium]